MFDKSCFAYVRRGGPPTCGDQFTFLPRVGPPWAVRFAEDGQAEEARPPPGAGGSGSDAEPPATRAVAGGEPERTAAPCEADEIAEVKARLVAEARKYRRRAQEAERRVADLQPRVLSDAERELFERLKFEAERLPEIQEAHRREVAELKQAHADELAGVEATAQRLTEMLSEVVGTDRLKTALAARGVKRVDQAASLLAGRIRVGVAGDDYTVQVVDDRGEPVSDGRDAKEAGVEELVDAWLAENPHFLPPSGDTGSGARAGTTVPGGVSIEQLDRNPQRKAEFVAKHGPGALVQLARGPRERKGG